MSTWFFLASLIGLALAIVLLYRRTERAAITGGEGSRPERSPRVPG